MSVNINQEKQLIIDKLKSLRNKLLGVEKGFKIDLSELISKVNQAINNVEDDVFSIAFFGAFSDGKSTILSVLSNNLDIKISPEPTTDKIQKYELGDYQIIDTPGLFSENLIHDDLTKKYISEANIIIYTVDPVNPLKDSHLSTIRWIMSDLKKHESTVFVINKMDEVADLEDDNDFDKNAEIKKEVISRILREEVGIDQKNRIICVAADPFELGLSYWKNNTDYKRLSRIDSLEKMILEFKSTYKNELIVKAGLSVIRDASACVILELDKIKITLVSEVDLLKSQIEEFNSRVNVLEGDINRSYINIKEECISLREDVLLEIDSVSTMMELGEAVQKRLGEDCYILQEKIDLIIRKHTGNLLTESKEVFESLEESLFYHSNIQNEIIGKLSDTGKSVVKGMLGDPTRKIADAVIKARDFLKIPFKFKPWGALKFAKFLKVMPVVMESLQLIVGVWGKLKIDKKRSEVKKEMETAFKGLIQNITLEKYTDTYFPFVSETRNVLATIEESKIEIQGTITNLDKIRREINIELLD
ncbi:dynamin family protein [Desulforhopalus vacuolatus]|uniref:LeoA/HP0731 family dynamin-like GTPase n=1 Tax=Desulforhopalus vacuolatus TaxID=40414 RepID=UPI001966C912|nr:LeoA/HP0731 family dynamin-like GTPase [Desulforhopalus vacuolatus]MBM9520609.1 dynamin family protein [Desulforhopalus vacuolatus]